MEISGHFRPLLFSTEGLLTPIRTPVVIRSAGIILQPDYANPHTAAGTTDFLAKEDFESMS